MAAHHTPTWSAPARARPRCANGIGADINVTRFGTPEDIAGLIAFMVSPRGRWLHGATIDMDGGEVPTAVSMDLRPTYC